MKFHERFDIAVGLEEAQKRFVNRAFNEVWHYSGYVRSDASRMSIESWHEIERKVMSALGRRYTTMDRLSKQVGTDFHDNLLALEVLYAALDLSRRPSIKRIIEGILSQSEVDLGVEWRDGKFFRKGAVFLGACRE